MRYFVTFFCSQLYFMIWPIFNQFELDFSINFEMFGFFLQRDETFLDVSKFARFISWQRSRSSATGRIVCACQFTLGACLSSLLHVSRKCALDSICGVAHARPQKGATLRLKGRLQVAICDLFRQIRSSQISTFLGNICDPACYDATSWQLPNSMYMSR